MSDKPPFRADHVGSFLRPMALLDARAALPVTFAPDWYDRKVGSIVLMAGGWRDATRVGGRPQPNARK